MGSKGKYVQRINGREVRLDNLEGLKAAVEHAVENMVYMGMRINARVLQAALDDAFPPPSPKEV